MAKILAAVLTFNEGDKLKKLLTQFDQDGMYDILLVDDGSTDDSFDSIEKDRFKIIRHDQNLGVGAGIKTAVNFARQNSYDSIVIMAGNGKMLPVEIPRLLKPILENDIDYVQGSRYLEGGRSDRLPLFRRVMIKLFTIISNIILGQKGTDITCGFRAYKLSIFEDPEIDIDQSWLNQYELEYYLHYKVVKRKYRIEEVPVSMIYPKEGKNYSKIKPFVGWWSMVRPWIFLSLRLKK